VFNDLQFAKAFFGIVEVANALSLPISISIIPQTNPCTELDREFT
jgi:hypothetical protein